MSKRRPAKPGETPEPFRYRPTPPPPIEPAKQPRKPPCPGLTAGKVSNPAAAGLTLLLVLPAFALHRLSETADWRLVAGVALLVSLMTWSLYRNDKLKAQTGAWRTPESTLHLAGLAGGWPAAFLAQRRFRHKIAKTRFQVFYWSIVFLHQFAALDYLLGWKSSLNIFRVFR